MAKDRIVPPDPEAWKRLTRKQREQYLAHNQLAFRNGRFYPAKKK